jgi:hypothetical protein
MLTIARFNWPFYVAAAVVMVASMTGIFLFSALALKLICAAAGAGAAYFLFVSLGVSHLVYDRSDLYRWGWLNRALRNTQLRDFIFCHSGFDEASTALRQKLPGTDWAILDFFNETQMTEPSIRRARALFPPTAGTLPAIFDRWPVRDQSADAVFGLLAIHEFRSEAERTAWFAEAKRCLRGSARIVLVEHLRDTANFIAFGPGFLHFHSRASWSRAWSRAGLRLLDEFRITPWVRVFILTPA